MIYKCVCVCVCALGYINVLSFWKLWMNRLFYIHINGYNLNVNIYTSWIAQLAGAVEYTDCFSADV